VLYSLQLYRYRSSTVLQAGHESKSWSDEMRACHLSPHLLGLF